MDAITYLAEQRIQQAIEEGAFENLPGKGRPLNLEDDSHIPEDWRMAHKLLKNANMLPPELETRQEMQRLQEHIDRSSDDEERRIYIRRLRMKQLQLDLALEKTGRHLPQHYANQAEAALLLSERN